MEQDEPVVYCYEVQVDPRWQGQGIGGCLVRCMESIGKRCGFHVSMLTVLRNNPSALKFYLDRLNYDVDACSPSQCGEADEAYEILSKCLDE
jgi:ribosomal protein S18 acetylase RimI-like enzyme